MRRCVGSVPLSEAELGYPEENCSPFDHEHRDVKHTELLPHRLLSCTPRETHLEPCAVCQVVATKKSEDYHPPRGTGTFGRVASARLVKGAYNYCFPHDHTTTRPHDLKPNVRIRLPHTAQ